MKELIQAYLKGTGEFDHMPLVILNFEPVIKYNEQCWEVGTENICLYNSVETRLVSVSDLLGFMYSQSQASN